MLLIVQVLFGLASFEPMVTNAYQFIVKVYPSKLDIESIIDVTTDFLGPNFKYKNKSYYQAAIISKLLRYQLYHIITNYYIIMYYSWYLYIKYL